MKVIAAMKEKVLFSVAAWLCAFTLLASEAYVGSALLAVRERPDNLSRCVCVLKFGDKVSAGVTVRSVPEFAGNRNRFPKTLVPCWAMVECSIGKGYVPVHSLVARISEDDRQIADTIARKMGSDVAKNFSEAEDSVALASMKGAAGSLKIDGVSMGIDKVVDIVCDEGRGPLDDEAVKAFVSDGGLNERLMPVTDSGKILFPAEKAFADIQALSSRVKALGKMDADMKMALEAASSLAVMMAIDEIVPKTELALGMHVVSKPLGGCSVVPGDDPRSIYVNKVGQTIVSASACAPFLGFRFVLLESKDVNAFAVPGGIICVYTGLLDFLESEDELAVVLGHEVAHVELRHGIKGVDDASRLAICSKVLGFTLENDEELSGESAKVKKNISKVLDEMFNRISNGYSADLEGQADWRALQLVSRIGYDARAMVGLMGRFKAKFNTYGGAKYPEKRGADIEKYCGQLGIGEDAVPGRQMRAMRYRMTVGR